LETNEKIAEIAIDTESRRIQYIKFYETKLRFRCQRCAIFCCKLGGPRPSEKDIQRLKHVKSDPVAFLDSNGYIQSKKDKSCVFLKSCANKIFECSIYNFRPSLCRLYPFHVERSSPNLYTLKLISCCSGLNVEDGELANENFIVKYLLDAFFDLSYP
jgi:Fe-S-cluster containining protein